ncbi:hypothetical protein LSUB1_G006345 [Lachnellula subtilissima]|uniref:Uncharacterized protein n=1 Tax=Lachnellula subtilissima TaxID=602034 RepID=A0A8H8RH26_9HELO|nr:hypothetical protein LSUB1_G006345 [Lachnellula subtilissima]
MLPTPGLLGQVGPQELDHFDYFRIECTEEFSGFFDQNLWKQLILQAAHTELFILQAVLSIGALRRSQLAPHPPRAINPVVLEYSLRKYSIASKILGLRIKAGTVDWKIVVLGSLVLLAIEVLEGHESGALMHLKNGAAILKGILLTTADASSTMGVGGTTFPYIQHGIETEYLVAAFTRLSVQELPFFGVPSSGVPPAPTMASQKFHFTNVREARQSLNSIIAAVHAFVRRYGQPDVRISPLRALSGVISTEISYLQTILRSWIQTFNSFYSLLEKVDAETSLAANVLIVQYYVSWVKTSCFLDEMIYDQYLPWFEEILEQSKAIILAEGDPWSKSRGPCFTLDIATAQPLYLVARKCRDPQLRRRAVELMKKVGTGICTGRTIAKVAEWITRTEEDSTGMFVVAGHRLHDVYFDFHQETRIATVLATRRDIDGTLQHITETLNLPF